LLFRRSHRDAEGNLLCLHLNSPPASSDTPATRQPWRPKSDAQNLTDVQGLRSEVRGPRSEARSPDPEARKPEAYLLTSLISPIKLFSESRKNVIHKS
jgi:hypothetical protein